MKNIFIFYRNEMDFNILILNLVFIDIFDIYSEMAK